VIFAYRHKIAARIATAIVSKPADVTRTGVVRLTLSIPKAIVGTTSHRRPCLCVPVINALPRNTLATSWSDPIRYSTSLALSWQYQHALKAHQERGTSYLHEDRRTLNQHVSRTWCQAASVKDWAPLGSNERRGAQETEPENGGHRASGRLRYHFTRHREITLFWCRQNTMNPRSLLLRKWSN